MFGIFMESLVIFKLYTGLKFLFVLTLVSFLYLLITEKDKTIRQLFVYAPVLILVLFLFPVSRKLFVAMGLVGRLLPGALDDSDGDDHRLRSCKVYGQAQEDRPSCQYGADRTLRQLCVQK